MNRTPPFLALAASLFCATALPAAAATPQTMFYMTETRKSVNDFEAHFAKVDLLVPTWYTVDQDGLVSGGPDAYVLDLARKNHVPVMPILSNADRPKFHALLADPAGIKAMIASMIGEAKRNGYVGFQFDFESIVWTDRDALSALVRQAAAALHAQGLKLTMAVIPNGPGHAGQGAFSKWMWQYWRGAFDLASLGQSLDSMCLMTYDQHTRWTTPGPVGGWVWTTQQLAYAEKQVPRDKILLGVPLYGYRWYAGDPVKPDGTEASNIVGTYFDADESIPMAKEFGAHIQWDPAEHESFYSITRDDMREWVFMPDARSFGDRYALARQDGLKGICAWELGSEDPKVWDLLPDAVR